MKLTNLVMSILFACCSYYYLVNDGTVISTVFGISAFVTFLAMIGRSSFYPTVAMLLASIGTMVWIFPQTNTSSGMFYSSSGQVFMWMTLVAIWMTSILVEYLRHYEIPPLLPKIEEVVAESEEESSEVLDSAQP